MPPPRGRRRLRLRFSRQRRAADPRNKPNDSDRDIPLSRFQDLNAFHNPIRVGAMGFPDMLSTFPKPGVGRCRMVNIIFL